LTRVELEQLKWLKKEVEQARKDYLNAKPIYEADSVVGSTPDRWDKHVIPVTGNTYQDIDRKLKRYERLIRKLEGEIEYLEDWIESIPDSLMRQILQLRYRNDMGWGQIGQELGYDRTTIAKKHNAFFEGK
jgi:hypothetical protein